jgi:hypothetical protein
MKTLLILAIVIMTSQVFAKEGKIKDLPKQLRQHVVEQVESQLDLLEDSDADNSPNEIWSLGRINFRTFAFMEYDILFFEMKIMPYVELRWDKKLPAGYKVYHPQN